MKVTFCRVNHACMGEDVGRKRGQFPEQLFFLTVKKKKSQGAEFFGEFTSTHYHEETLTCIMRDLNN